jgi:nickel-type superoxide dismutase maturation protease
MRRTLGRAVIAVAALAALARVLRWRAPLARYAVEGDSMEPAYRAGDRVIVNRLAYRRRAPAPGDVVVLRDPERPGRYLLKRVAPFPAREPPDPDAVYVLGDNAAGSRDSRSFGPVPRSAIVGRAWQRY